LIVVVTLMGHVFIRSCERVRRLQRRWRNRKSSS